MSFLTETFNFFTSTRRSIGGLTGYITMVENATDKLTVTKHPVQQGAMITDHAYKEPCELNIQIIQGTAFDPIGLLSGGSPKPLKEVYQDFLAIQNNRERVEVITGKRSYKDMILQSISQTTDKNTENVLSLNLSFIEIIIVSVQTAFIAPRTRQANAGITGATEKAGKKSILVNTKEGVTTLANGIQNLTGGN